MKDIYDEARPIMQRAMEEYRRVSGEPAVPASNEFYFQLSAVMMVAHARFLRGARQTEVGPAVEFWAGSVAQLLVDFATVSRPHDPSTGKTATPRRSLAFWIEQINEQADKVFARIENDETLGALTMRRQPDGSLQEVPFDFRDHLPGARP